MNARDYKPFTFYNYLDEDYEGYDTLDEYKEARARFQARKGDELNKRIEELLFPACGRAFNHEADSEAVVEEMAKRGYWCQERSPFTPREGLYGCGFTPHGTTGWNGKPDHWTLARSRGVARCLSAIAALAATQEQEES